MNTNDEQAKYIKLGESNNGVFTPDPEAIAAGFRFEGKGCQPMSEFFPLPDEQGYEQRAPMFKLEDVKCAMKAQGWSCSDDEARKALHFIDAKITSGELMPRSEFDELMRAAADLYNVTENTSPHMQEKRIAFFNAILNYGRRI